jgi:hypothetical protein
MVVPVAMGMAVLALRRVVVLVPVVPQLGLVQQEEEHQAHQQRGEQLMRPGLALERLGQQVHEGRGQQRTCGQAQQMARAHTVGPRAQPGAQKPGGKPHAADPGSQSGRDDCYQSHSY